MSPDLVALLAVLTARDGVRWPTDTVSGELALACTAGAALACALQEDRDAIGPVLARACAAGDAAACLGEAWTLLPPKGSGVDESAPIDPARFRDLVERSCAEGVARACTELGTVYLYGHATYPGWRRAAQQWLAGCEAGEAHACTAAGRLIEAPAAYVRARALGDPTADLALADGDTREAPRLLARACDAGVTAACFRAASVLASPDEAARHLADVCALGDPQACALRVVLVAARGSLSPEQAIEALRPWCPAVRSACEELAFLEDGVVPVFPWRGETPMGFEDTKRLLFDLGPPLHECLLDAVARNRSAGGPVDVVWRTEVDGRVSAVWVPGAYDPAHATCVEGVFRQARPRPPVGGPMRSAVVLRAWHGAEVELSPLLGTEAAFETTTVADDTPSWAGPLDDCLLDRAGAVRKATMTLELTATRAGDLRDVVVVDSSGEPGVDTCVAEWIEAHDLPEGPRLSFRMRARVAFLERTVAPRRPAIARRPLVGPQPSTEVRMLVVALERSRVSGKPARLDRSSLNSIFAVHAQLAEYVEQQTRGRVRIAWEVRLEEGHVDSGFLDQEDGMSRWNLDPGDLPADLVDALRPEDWDSVFVYVPIPRGFPRPWRGVTWYGGLGGASFSSLAIPSGSEVFGNPTVPPFALPLHEWWHQVEARARAVLAAVPSNHEVLQVGDGSLDPRDWLRTDTAMDWYEEVLRLVHPELWQVAWSRRIDADLAAIVEDADDARLVDGLVGDGGFGWGAPLDAEGTGLAWDGKVPITRVIVHLAFPEGATDEVSVTVGAGDATVAATVVPARQVRLELPFAATADTLTVRATGPVPEGAVVTEIEVR